MLGFKGLRGYRGSVLLELLLAVSFSSELSFESWSLRSSAAYTGHKRDGNLCQAGPGTLNQRQLSLRREVMVVDLECC